MDEDKGLTHFAMAWYWFLRTFLAIITAREEARKGRIAPNVKNSKLTVVSAGFLGIIATRIADENMGIAYGAAMSVYERPKINAPK